jgi:hypothetical protein
MAPDGSTSDEASDGARADNREASTDAKAGLIDAAVDASADAQADVSRDGGADAPIVPAIDASIDARDASACAVDCSQLPNVRPGTIVSCVAGQCVVPYGSCIPGFAHCTANSNDGCETDLSRPANCGGCLQTCSIYAPSCVSQSGSFNCVPTCTPPLQACGYACVDVSSDPNNCGACNSYCYLPNAQATCTHGTCAVLSCYNPDFADCTADPGCETRLGSADDCSRCGDRACAIPNTLLSCTSATNCAAAVCAPGFGNCDVASPDCEASFSAGASCLPDYVGTVGLGTLDTASDAPVAIGSDGSYFLGGEFSGTVDFDPTSTMDIRTAVDALDGYISKYDANGNYAWTRTFAGRGDIRVESLAGASGGAIMAVGSYRDTVDLDPGAAVDLHQSATTFNADPFVVKLAADGSFVWGKAFPTALNGNGGGGEAVSVAVDAADAVYVAGSFSGDIDLDPGPITDAHTAAPQAGFVVKLSSAGAFTWSSTVTIFASCSNWLTGLAVAPDGSTWASGITTGNCLGPLPDGGPSPQGEDGFVLGLGPTGDVRRTWLFAGPADNTLNAVAIGTDGSIYVGGQSHGNVDLDPGPGVAERWVPNAGGFIVSLGPEGTFHWAQTVDGVPIGSLSATADGGVLAAGTIGSLVFVQPTGAFVTKLNGDGTSAWSFNVGTTSTSPRAVAASSTGFALTGSSSGSADFNPGAGFDIVFGDVTFLSRYTF